jgi:hypothetical protein
MSKTRELLAADRAMDASMMVEHTFYARLAHCVAAAQQTALSGLDFVKAHRALNDLGGGKNVPRSFEEVQRIQSLLIMRVLSLQCFGMLMKPLGKGPHLKRYLIYGRLKHPACLMACCHKPSGLEAVLQQHDLFLCDFNLLVEGIILIFHHGHQLSAFLTQCIRKL